MQPGAAQGGVQLRAVAQHAAADLPDQRQILPPAVVMAAFGHLVATDAAAVEGGGAVLDAGGKEEALVGQGMQGGGAAGRGGRESSIVVASHESVISISIQDFVSVYT